MFFLSVVFPASSPYCLLSPLLQINELVLLFSFERGALSFLTQKADGFGELRQRSLRLLRMYIPGFLVMFSFLLVVIPPFFSGFFVCLRFRVC